MEKQSGTRKKWTESDETFKKRAEMEIYLCVVR